jgi:EAL domain-containing protein (putative c-di-GMP-specific phosphodiesterase class I)
MIKTHDILAQKFQEIPLRFSLNLSTKQLLDPELANTFIDIINKANAKPEHYMLEISDFMMLEKIAVIKTNVYKLRDFGFKIAVDGFEVDGQSVQVIQRAPIDVIKLGRNFLKDIENNFMKERLLEILVKFATENNRSIVSEGVETPEVAKYVKDQNVFLEQGYLFGKPMSADAFNEYLEKHQYKVILEDVTNIEDTEKIMRMVGGDTDTTDDAEEELSAEDLLNQTVAANATTDEVVEEEDVISDGSFDDFLDDESSENN